MNDMLLQHGIGVSGGSSNIKSIQRIRTSIASSATELDVPISSVDVNKSIVILKPVVPTPIRNDTYCNARFLSASGMVTTIRINRYNYGYTLPSLELDITVIEFNSVKSKQNGSIYVPSISSSNSNTQTQNITLVDLNKSFLFVTLSQQDKYVSSINIYPETNVTFNNNSLVFNANLNTDYFAYWQVIEFN